MKKLTIEICGKEYPCRQTMGSMLRFKRETGRDITATDGGAADMCVYLWCCVVSACKADGVEFGMGLEDFADCIEPEQLAAWSEAVAASRPDGAGKGEKKTARRV